MQLISTIFYKNYAYLVVISSIFQQMPHPCGTLCCYFTTFGVWYNCHEWHCHHGCSSNIYVLSLMVFAATSPHLGQHSIVMNELSRLWLSGMYVIVRDGIIRDGIAGIRDFISLKLLAILIHTSYYYYFSTALIFWLWFHLVGKLKDLPQNWR